MLLAKKTCHDFDFISKKKVAYFASILFILISFISIMTKGFNFGVDFLGGINIEINTTSKYNLPHIRKELNKLNVGEVFIQQIGQDNNNLSIKFRQDKNELSQSVNLIKDKLSKIFQNNIEYRKISFVGPQVSSHMMKSSSKAIILCFLAIMFYVWFRFDRSFGLGIVITLIHNVIISVGFMSLLHYEVNLSTIAALLTIIGYSVNDCVVIYDRVRENKKKSTTNSFKKIINSSINETLTRTTITVLTTLLANIAIILFGGEAIQSFSILVFFGIIIGTYASIFISSSILEDIIKFGK